MANETKGFTTNLLRQLDPLAAALRSARGDGTYAQKTARPKTKAAAKKTPKSPSARRQSPKKSPLAPEKFPDLPPLDNVRVLTAETGMKYAGRPDLLIVHLPSGTQTAGVFTRSTMPSAPVEWCRSVVDTDQGAEEVRVLVVNAGNANAFTGRSGRDEVRATVAAAGKAFGCRQRDVVVASTGVIGEKMPERFLGESIEKRVAKEGEDNWAQAAQAIMTTDTFPKGAHAVATIDGASVNIVGIAKGSGMIAPDMATMLSFIWTDATIPANILQTLLSVGVRHSFNAITVDGDTSTSDTVLLFATGQVSDYASVTRIGDRRLIDFRKKLTQVMVDLAHQVVRDGEGAKKFIAITVKGAASARAARNVAMAIGNSPLVKTAIAGEDANWGRIVMAVGKSGEAADRDRISIWFGDHRVAVKGEADAHCDEAAIDEYLQGQSIEIVVELGMGPGENTVWTCDLTHDYISINADYRS